MDQKAMTAAAIERAIMDYKKQEVCQAQQITEGYGLDTDLMSDFVNEQISQTRMGVMRLIMCGLTPPSQALDGIWLTAFTMGLSLGWHAHAETDARLEAGS